MFAHLLTSKFLRRLTALACVGSPAQLFAADPPAAPAVGKPVAISDVSLARAALAAFDADPVLRDAQILVSVVDRGAVIGGPVGSDEVRRRAEAVVRAVPGIESVKNACFVDADPDPLLRAVAARMKPGAPAAPRAALPGVALPPAAADGFLPKVPPQPPTDLVAVAPTKTVVAQHPGLLGPPVGVLGAPVLPRPTNPPTLPLSGATSPGALTGAGAKPADVAAAVAAIRAADVKFARLAAELRPGGEVLVTGSVPKAADAWEFAARVREATGARVAFAPGVLK